LGEKKIEYGVTGFNYSKFLFGKPKCKESSPEYKGFIETLQYAFK